MGAIRGAKLIDIREVAKVFQSSIETMRKYKKLKIIEPRKTVGRKDMFDYAEVREIKELIENYKCQGKSIKEIINLLLLQKYQTKYSTVNSKKILIVEDDIATVDVLIELLQDNFNRGDVEIFSAKDGDEAIQMAAISHFELIVIDIGLPGDSGFVVYKKLLGCPNTYKTNYIFMSGLVQYEKQCPMFIPKPFKPSEFLNVVNSMLRTVST
ncbi:MAG: response regulator [Syntrophobacteraceae bacterium]